MAIQSEAVDEDLEHFEDATDDLEHFEDAPDDTEDSPGTEEEAIMPSRNGGDEENDIKLDSDNDSSEDEEASLAFSSEEDMSGEDEDLLMRKNIEKPQESSSSKLPEDSGKQLESLPKQLLPGGYDPRHREPSFWYDFANNSIFFPSLK